MREPITTGVWEEPADRELKRLRAENKTLRTFMLENYHCPRSNGFEGPYTFPACGGCVYCKTVEAAEQGSSAIDTSG